MDRGVGNTSILQMPRGWVPSEGVGSLPSWDFSVIQPALENRHGVGGGSVWFFVFVFFNASSFSDDMLFFVTDSWQVISYLPCH